MPQPEWFEVLVLSGGSGGKLVAWHMAQSGRRTAVALKADVVLTNWIRCQRAV